MDDDHSYLVMVPSSSDPEIPVKDIDSPWSETVLLTDDIDAEDFR